MLLNKKDKHKATIIYVVNVFMKNPRIPKKAVDAYKRGPENDPKTVRNPL